MEPGGTDPACLGAVLDQHPLLQPSSGAVCHVLDLDPVPLSARVARTFVSAAFAMIDGDSEDVALLLTSELVTNAVLHARTPLQLAVLLDGDTALVGVADRLPGSPALAPLEQSGHRFGGRGLALVADVAQAWGTTTYTGGKTVWFLLRTVADPERRTP